MTFEEAMARAKAMHVVVRTYRQPGNDYRTEHECKCGGGRFGSIFATEWDHHVLDAADALLREAEEGGSE